MRQLLFLAALLCVQWANSQNNSNKFFFANTGFGVNWIGNAEGINSSIREVRLA